MRIVVTGATGNVGTSVLPALAAEPAVDSMLGLARRLPSTSWPKAEFAAVDVADPDADLAGCLREADDGHGDPRRFPGKSRNGIRPARARGLSGAGRGPQASG